MKKIIILSLFLILQACNSQSKIDLESIPFEENMLDNFKKNDVGKMRGYDPHFIWTSMPATSTEDITKFKFGEIEFEKAFSKSELADINFLWKSADININKNEGKISGIYITINENSDQTERIYQYLLKKYGKPNKTYGNKPKPNKEGLILGDESFVWNNPKLDRVFIFSKEYHSPFDKNVIGTNLFIINKNAKDLGKDPKKTLIDRLLESY